MKIFQLSAIVAASFLLWGCVDHNQELNGYKIFSPYNGMYSIVAPNDKFVVQPNLKKWAICGDFWFGYCVPHKFPDGVVTTEGYFALDTRSGLATDGMTLGQFKAYVSKSSQCKYEDLNFRQTFRD